MSGVPSADASDPRDPVDVLSETFLRRLRAGEAIEVEAFAAAHPEHEAALKDLLPTLLLLERMKRQEESSASGLGRPRVGVLQRLGDFRIEREIGRGGMGVVFEAVQEALGRHVALKVLPQSHLLTGHQLERFQREAQTAAKLHHSNIVPVFGCGEADGYHYYAMQFIDGHGLDRWITERKEQPLDGPALLAHCRAVARFGVEVAEALHYAHGQGTLHRDVKPSNLLLDRKGHVWVTDFGLAKALEQDGLTVSGDLLGTLQYMAPEQFRGLYDERSEVYALGLSLYELLTLRPAYAGRTRSELIEKIRNSRPERLQKLLPGMPHDLATIVERATARDPKDRYASAQQLAADLERYLQDRPILARRHSGAELLWRWCRHHRALAAMSASIAALVLLAAIGGWIMYGITRDALQRARDSATTEHQAQQRAQATLHGALDLIENVFDTLVGPDPFHAFEEDPDTGEYTGIVRTAVDPRAAAVMKTMLPFYDLFAAANAGDSELEEQTARAYRRVGGIQFRLGNFADSRTAYEKSLQLYRDVHQRDTHLELASVQLDLARTLLASNAAVDAQQRCREALATLDNGPGSKRQRFEAAQAHVLLLWALWWPGSDLFGELRPDRPGRGGGEPWRGTYKEELRQHLTAANQLLDELLAGDHDNPEVLELKARLLRFLARPRAKELEGDADPQQAHEQAIAILRGLVERFPDADYYRFELVDTLLFSPGAPPPGAEPPRGSDNQQRAVLRLREALESAARLVAQQPEVSTYRSLLARAQAELGRQLLARKGSAAEAAELLQAALAHARGQLVERGTDKGLQIQSAMLRFEAARALHELQRDDEARVLVAETVAVVLDLIGDGAQSDFEVRDAMAGGLGRLAAGRMGPPGLEPPRGRGELVRLLDDLSMRDADSELLRSRIEALRQRLEAMRQRLRGR